MVSLGFGRMAGFGVRACKIVIPLSSLLWLSKERFYTYLYLSSITASYAAVKGDGLGVRLLYLSLLTAASLEGGGFLVSERQCNESCRTTRAQHDPTLTATARSHYS